MKIDGNTSNAILGNHLLGMTSACFVAVVVMKVFIGDPGLTEPAGIVGIVGAFLALGGILFLYENYLHNKETKTVFDGRFLILLTAFEMALMGIIITIF